MISNKNRQIQIFEIEILWIEMSISEQDKIAIIINHKNQIVQLTNRMLQMVDDSDSSCINEQKRLLKQYLNQTISELTIIAGFCGSKERKWVSAITDTISRLSPILEWCLPTLIDLYCTLINGIIIDFSKTPFSFLNDDLRRKWREFENRTKAVRKGQW